MTQVCAKITGVESAEITDVIIAYYSIRNKLKQ
jgi:hypothetical protein